MKIIINHKFESINNYINQCRTNYHVANKTKQQETMLSALAFTKIPPIKKYPIELIFYWHIKNKTSDLDGRLPKKVSWSLYDTGKKNNAWQKPRVIFC